MKSVLVGVLGLAFLDLLLTSNNGAGLVGGAFTGAAGALQHFLSPSVPLIPDLRSTS